MENTNLEQRLLLLEKRVEEVENKLSVNNINQVLAQSNKISIKEFLLTKKIDDDTKCTLVIAYFIEHIENVSPFNTDDLKKAFRLAKIKLPSNINDKININIHANRIMEAEKKKESKKAWELTAKGEAFVENKLNNINI